jgi:hypothetical protein
MLTKTADQPGTVVHWLEILVLDLEWVQQPVGCSSAIGRLRYRPAAAQCQQRLRHFL